MTGAYPNVKPMTPLAALPSEILRRRINNIHNAPTKGIASSKHQMLTPDTNPKINTSVCFRVRADPTDAKSIVSTGIDTKYQE